jgi:hypothetical protein
VCVVCRPSLDPLAPRPQQQGGGGAARDTPAAGAGAGGGTEAVYQGCFSSESLFEHRLYAGGRVGANIDAGIKHAVGAGRRYIALASNGQREGHAFAFASFSKTDKKQGSGRGDRPDAECDVPCTDEPAMSCGCADGGCLAERLEGEQNNRRWSVYKLAAAKAEKKK